MPPNTIEIPVAHDPEMMMKGAKPIDPPRPEPRAEEKYNLQILQASLNLMAHLFIGATLFINLFFAFRNGLPLGPTPLHIVLCVVGYQLLMAEAILALTSDNGWTSKFRLVDKRRAHWILQILGSGLALGGSFWKILDKNIHWDTLHGQFALVAMVFTAVSLVNGLTSLYAYELRKVLPSNLSKLSHICFGVVAFAAASISLCYGYDKNSFRTWATVPLTYLTMAVCAAFTLIIIINPLITFFNKSVKIAQN